MNFEELKRVLDRQNEDKQNWSHYTNPDGKMGGWVECTVGVADNCYIGREAVVAGRSHITNGSRVEGKAYIKDATLNNSTVRGETTIIGGTYEGAALENAIFYQGEKAAEAGKPFTIHYSQEHSKTILPRAEALAKHGGRSR